jgi:hypothetical protein
LRLRLRYSSGDPIQPSQRPARLRATQPTGDAKLNVLLRGRNMTNLSEVGHCGLFCIVGAVRLRTSRGANRSDRPNVPVFNDEVQLLALPAKKRGDGLRDRSCVARDVWLAR